MKIKLISKIKKINKKNYGETFKNKNIRTKDLSGDSDTIRCSEAILKNL